VLNTVDIDVFRGDPHSPTYEDHVPAARPPNVFANGTVTDSAQACGDPIATFLITVSEFVRNSRKQSVVLYVLSPCTLLSSHFGPQVQA
jgi:hypothetical protein